MARPRTHHHENRDRILKVAEGLFVDKGYHETSIEDILRATEISKGGFYHYFKSKSQLLTGSVQKMIDDLVVITDRIASDQNLSALDKFEQFIHFKAQYQVENWDYAKLLARLLQEDEAQMVYYLSISKALVPPLAKILHQGSKEGVFRIDHSNEVADIIVRIMTTHMTSVFYEDYQRDEDRKKVYYLTLEETINRILGTSKNIKLFE